MKKCWQFIAIMLILSACNKGEEAAPLNNNTASDFKFNSLEPESDTILTGTKTKITALVDGNGITYAWEGPVGIITGSGHQVFFFACCQGDHFITCTVKDSKGNSDSKTVNIYGL